MHEITDILSFQHSLLNQIFLKKAHLTECHSIICSPVIYLDQCRKTKTMGRAYPQPQSFLGAFLPRNILRVLRAA